MNTSTTNPRETTVVGVFNGFAEARRAVETLRAAGYTDDMIGVLGPDPDHKTEHHHTGLLTDATHTRWEEGAGIGAAAGGAAGLGLGLAVAAGLISPLAPVVAGGALLALLASAGTGAAVGTVVGALCGLGIPEEDACWYAKELDAGRVVVTVHPDREDVEAVADTLRKCGAEVKSGAGIGVYGTGLTATPY
ncbi:MAG: hypothetical protein JWO38_2880 [Gemmataceae bacterium]|nr:hypothetical protein [Gemmataceae bacterium]